MTIAIIVVEGGSSTMMTTIGSVPVKVAAQVYKKDPSWVRAGLISGYLPIGHATRNGRLVTDIREMGSKNGRINYYISPIKLYQDTGYEWEGESNVNNN